MIQLNQPQRAFDVAEQIGFGFEAGGKAHQTVADSELCTVLGLEPRMSRCRRVSDKALRVSEIVGDVDESQRIKKAEAGFLAAGDVEADKTAALLHLAAREFVLRMAREPGVK